MAHEKVHVICENLCLEEGMTKEQILKEKSNLQNEIEVERQRINGIASLEEGSTTGDAELIDVRVGADGVTYPSAGNSVRSQIGNLNKLATEAKFDYMIASEMGSIGSDGVLGGETNNHTRRSANFYDTSLIESINISNSLPGTLYICYYDKNKNFISRTSITAASTLALHNPYFKFYLYSSSVVTDVIFRGTFSITRKNRVLDAYKITSAISSERIKNIANMSICEIGGITASGDNSTQTDRIRTKSILYLKKNTVIYTRKGYMFVLAWFDNEGNYIGDSGWIYNDYVMDSDKYAKIIMTNVNKQTVTNVNTIASNFSIFTIEDIQKYPHYFDFHIKNKIDTINSNKLSMDDGVGFVFITDTHWEQNQQHSPDLIDEVSKKTGIGTVVHGGDYLRGQSTSSDFLKLLSEIVRKYKDVSNVFLPVYGNHEWNYYGSETIDKKYTYSSIFGDVQNLNGYSFIDTKNSSYTGATCNYFYDNVNQKFRYIILNTSANGQINKRHLAWLKDTIMNTPNGYTIAVICHIIWTNEQFATTVDAQILFDMFDAVNAKTTYTSTTSDKTVSCDFSTKDLTIACILCGHTHKDHDSTTTGGIPVICTTCDAYLQDKSTENTVGTYKEQAFDVIQIDTINKHIYLTRIGYGEDRTFDY